MKNKQNRGSSGMKLFVFGASLAGLAAAYFFIGPKGKKNLENAKSWAIKMRGDIVEKLEQAREISEDIYNEIIDSVASKYEKKLKSNSEEIRGLAENLKTHWPALSKSIKDKKINSAKTESVPVKKKKIAK